MDILLIYCYKDDDNDLKTTGENQLKFSSNYKSDKIFKIIC